MLVGPRRVLLSSQTNDHAQADSFWVIAHAVRQFLERDDQGAGFLPLSGGFPDMKAESSTYVKLQNLYVIHSSCKSILTNPTGTVPVRVVMHL